MIPKRKVNRVFIHCSASDIISHDDVSVIRRWHLKRGWNDVGYHFFIKKNGVVQPGRNIENTPAAQKGNNTGTIAICLHGLKSFTENQFDALRHLCKKLQMNYENQLTFHGHCEVSNKICPVFDYKEVLNLDKEGNMIGE